MATIDDIIRAHHPRGLVPRIHGFLGGPIGGTSSHLRERYPSPARAASEVVGIASRAKGALKLPTIRSNQEPKPVVEIHLAQDLAHGRNLLGIDPADIELIAPKRTLDLDRIVGLRV